MRSIQGALIVASCFQVIIGSLGIWRNIVRCVYMDEFSYLSDEAYSAIIVSTYAYNNNSFFFVFVVGFSTLFQWFHL